MTAGGSRLQDGAKTADFFLTVPSPVGLVTIEATDQAIVRLGWGERATNRTSPLLKRAAEQLAAYFAGTRTDFDLPLAPAGSAFQLRVWEEMQAIPCGETATYGEIARRIGTAARAVGGSCAANPIPIIIPCHRVVAANGQPGGYSGRGGLSTKAVLLNLEQAVAGNR